MEVVDQIREANLRWAEAHFAGPASRSPTRHLVVLTCMDSRIDVFAALGLLDGEAHIIRNAGGVVTEDVLRSLVFSQRKLGTVDVVVVQHTDCGLHGFDDPAFRQLLERETGVPPHWDVPGFDDVDRSVRQQVQTIVDCAWVVADGGIAGFVYDVGTGHLRLVCQSANRPG